MYLVSQIPVLELWFVSQLSGVYSSVQRLDIYLAAVREKSPYLGATKTLLDTWRATDRTQTYRRYGPLRALVLQWFPFSKARGVINNFSLNLVFSVRAAPSFSSLFHFSIFFVSSILWPTPLILQGKESTKKTKSDFFKMRNVTRTWFEYEVYTRGVLREKLDGAVRPASQNSYPIYDQSQRFSLAYLWPDLKFDTLCMTWS